MSAGPRRALPDRRAHELFEMQARDRPDAIAAVHGDRQLNYGELNARANQLARALVARGVTREAVVGVMTERNLDWLIAVLAVFKAGGAYLPIEPHFPTERIAKMVSRAGAKLVLTQPLIEAAYKEGHAASDLGIVERLQQRLLRPRVRVLIELRLNLRDGLEDADDQPHHQADCEDRSGNHERQQQRVAAKIQCG